MREQTNFEAASKKKRILLIIKNYVVFVKYKTLHKERKTEQESLIRNFI